ncbi:hypothetical protein BJ970_005779 [Saccharopolyspora phatthalungensis]|uniref:Tn3 transposase DDE domain-containing protein n=1 Tax=Saccharopolyspora phatthalungensis TaxID=664693 RepID=A0A840QEB2_9PSEU|nr:hypothetical protein [Saccharopolyspora phatthalungensis]
MAGGAGQAVRHGPAVVVRGDPLRRRPDGQRVLAALRDLPTLWGEGHNKVDRSEIDEQLLIGSWRRLVLHAPELEPGTIDWRAYTFCVLEQFHRCLRRRDIFAVNSSKWGDPRAKLLAGKAWITAKPVVLSSLGLPPDPDDHLDERAELLDATFRGVAGRVPDNTAVHFDDAGRLHLAALPAEAEPPSLENLRVLTNRMLPRVDPPEVLLEVFSWTGADQAFTPVTGGEARLADPHDWGQKRGATWLNMVNDQAAGLAGKVVAGTPRDSLHVLDVLYDRDGGQRPQMIVTDTAS